MSRQAELTAVQPVVRRSRRMSWAWLGVGPFFVFSLLFLILPTLDLVIGAFQTPDGSFTLDNIARLNQPTIVSAYWISIQVSLASATLGAIAGFFIAYAVVLGKLPQGAPPVRHHLQRRRVAIRRHSARLRLPRDARADRPGDGVARPGVPGSISATSASISSASGG